MPLTHSRHLPTPPLPPAQVPFGEKPDPLNSLDAIMGALNLVRLLLTRASTTSKSDAPPPATPATAGEHAALRHDAVSQLLRESLEPLDKWVRTAMDQLWAEISVVERVEPPPKELQSMRMSFTHLHVATDVTGRAIELAKSFGS